MQPQPVEVDHTESGQSLRDTVPELRARRLISGINRSRAEARNPLEDLGVVPCLEDAPASEIRQIHGSLGPIL